LAYIFDPIQNTFIDDEDKSLGNKLALNDDKFQELLEIPGVIRASEAPQPPEKPAVKEIELFNRFNTDYPNIKDEKATGGRVNLQSGTNIKTLNPLFPERSVDFMSDEFQPIDVPGAIVPPLAIGAGVKRLKDIFFSKSEDENKKEIIPSDDQGSNIEPPKGPKFELKDVLTESVFESMRDPELRKTVKSIINEQKNFFDKKNVDKKVMLMKIMVAI
jgi:hypothetical protein